MPLNRRTLLTATGGALAASALPRAAAAATGAEMRERATRFIDSLEPAQRDAALFPFDTNQRVAWNFMLGSARAPGLALEQMRAPQKDLALDLLATGTSTLGLEKAMNIMLQQDILRDEWGKGRPDRNRERFSAQIYGLPSASDPWAWRWEGHHLSLTFTMVGDEIVSTTPSAFSSEPNTVPSGPHRGLVVLKDEEALGRALFTGLEGAERRAALAFEGSPGNIQSVRGADRQIAGQVVGLALGDMPEASRAIAERLIEVYTTEVLPSPLAATQAARLRGEDMAAARFAWGGANLEGSIYYRITGANFLIEFATLRNQPEHQHAVFHDTARNFGRHVV
ncbi:MAG: DUF3500 domain-containing protein [Pseudomonadota bacterium]